MKPKPWVRVPPRAIYFFLMYFFLSTYEISKFTNVSFINTNICNVLKFTLQIRSAMYGKNTSADDPKVKRIYTHSSNPGKNLLLALGFKLEKEKGKDMLVLPADVYCPLEEAYIAVFVMAS